MSNIKTWQERMKEAHSSSGNEVYFACQEIDELRAALTATEARLKEVKPDVSKMVDRFLGWKLPAGFHPDCGITFKRESDHAHPMYGRTKHEPTGTNLFDYEQAKAMFLYCLAAGVKA
jgi:hypothetical protein